MKSPRRSPYATVVALLLALILLAGLIVLASPILGLPSPVFIPAIVQEVRQAIAAGVLGLLLLLSIGYFVRHLKDLLTGRRERRKAKVSPEDLAVAYRRRLITELRQLKVMDMAGPFDLETSFIPLRVRGKPHLYFEGGESTAPTQSEIMSPKEALGRLRHLALLGEPGAGKTALIRCLALQASQGELEDLPDFPILVSLGHFAAAAPQDSLLDFVADDIDAGYGSLELRSYLKERLEEGSVLLLLDGLDGASVGRPRQADATYRHVVGQINVLAARYPKTPIVVTSRRAGWKGLLAASFHTLEMLKLEQGDIQRFIEDWFGRSSERALELQRTISQSPKIRALAANPLLLSLMALVFEQDGELPEGRTGLYKRSMELLLKKWETQRDRKWAFHFTAGHQRDLLEEMALHFHLRTHIFFPEDELSRITASYLSAVGLSADRAPIALERIGAQYGFLKEQALGWYSFSHLTWQEYFAAVAISKRGQLELALEGIPDLLWEGTTLFLAGMLEDATSLLEGILEQKDDIFHSNLLLAGRCLAGKSHIQQAGLRESIIEQLQRMVEGEYHPSSLFLRQRAIDVLTEIGDLAMDAYFFSFVTAPPRVGGKERGDWTVHRWVTTALASLGGESTVVNLVALLSDQRIDLAVRANIAAALGSLGDKSVVSRFLALLPDREVDYRVRMAVADALGALGDESVISQLLHLLPNEKIDYRVRVRIAEALGALGARPEPFDFTQDKRSRRDESITSQLLRLLSNEKVDYSVRMTVAEALGSLGDTSIAPQLLAILTKKKIDPDVRASVAAALGSLGDRSVIPQLLRLLPNEKLDPSIRWRIVDSLSALGAMDDGATVPQLLGLLADEEIDASVRVTMAEALGEMTATPRLPSIPTGKEAAKALSSLGDRSKVPQLLALLSDRELDRSIRLDVVEALGALGDDRLTVEGLAASLDDEEIGPGVYQALFLVGQRTGVRVFAKEGGGYEVR